MKKFMKKLSAIMLVAAMVCTTFLSYMPSLDVLAAPKMMAHLKAGSGNANDEAFKHVQSNSQTSEWYSYFENDVPDTKKACRNICRVELICYI